MIVPACKDCNNIRKMPELTGERDEDILTIPLGCLMCLFGTEHVIRILGIRKEEIKGEIPF